MSAALLGMIDMVLLVFALALITAAALGGVVGWRRDRTGRPEIARLKSGRASAGRARR